MLILSSFIIICALIFTSTGTFDYGFTALWLCCGWADCLKLPPGLYFYFSGLLCSAEWKFKFKLVVVGESILRNIMWIKCFPLVFWFCHRETNSPSTSSFFSVPVSHTPNKNHPNKFRFLSRLQSTSKFRIFYICFDSEKSTLIRLLWQNSQFRSDDSCTVFSIDYGLLLISLLPYDTP